MNRYVRSLLSIATLALALLYGLSLKPSLLAWCGLIIIVLLYLVMSWVHTDWWTRTRYALLSCPVIVLAVLLSLESGRNLYSWLLLLPLVLLLAREQQKYRRFAALLAAVTLVVMALVLPTYQSLLIVLPVVIALYFSVRAINIYKEANRLSQNHLQELDKAHRELQQTHAVLQEASVHSMRYAALAERARLAREMHDGLGHQLTSLIVQLQALEIMLPGEPALAAESVPAMLEVARKAMAEVRMAVRAWSEDESQLGLVALQGVISQSAASSGLSIMFEQGGGLVDWPLETSVALYRILQEALTNMMRHAEATAATVQVQEDDHHVILTISDNGRYTASAGLSPGFGIKGIMGRCEALGGSWTLSQNRPHGLKIQVRLPITQPVQDDGVLRGASLSNEYAQVSISSKERESL